MAEKTSEAFVERIPDFLEFMKTAGLNKKLQQGVPEKKQVDESHPLYNKTIVMTGFRDAAIQEKLKNIGAKIGSSISKNTFILLVKNLDEDTGKVSEAKNLGITIMTPESFKNKYL
jgi:NAD-dependent DNA ligase